MKKLYAVAWLLGLALLLGLLKEADANARARGPALSRIPAGLPVLSRSGGALVGQALRHDQSPPLRDLPVRKPLHAEVGDADNLPQVFPGLRHPIRQDPVVQGKSGAGPAAMPTPIHNFEGVANSDNPYLFYPPDTNGDVGREHYVQWVNISLAIWSKAGTRLYGPVPGNTLWQGFGGACEADNSGDPIALYDQLADRWILSQFAFNSLPNSTDGYHQCIAVSTTGDPIGAYYRYDFLISTIQLDDYPKFGIWPDAYYASFNMFDDQTSVFLGPAAVAFDRAQILAGHPASFQIFPLPATEGTLLPADLDGARLPPPGAPNPFLEAHDSAGILHLWKFHVDWSHPANSTFAGPTFIGVAPWNWLCPCIPQPGTTQTLASLGSRLMYRAAYRNFGDHEALVVNQAVDVDGSQHAGLRWYEIRNPSSTLSVYQQGTYAPNAANRWMGSVAMDGAGDLALGYSISSSSIYPGIRYTGRLATDPLGQLPQGEAILVAGGGSQTGASRWGDYSMMTIDPADDCTFWYTNEYYAATSEIGWQTRIGAFKFPSCVSSTPTPTVTGTPPTSTPTATPPSPFTATATPTATPTANPCLVYQATQASSAIIEPGTADTGNHCDDCDTTLALPFTFRLYGHAYSSARIGSNGTLQFATDWPRPLNTCLPLRLYSDTIFAYWDDIRTDAEGKSHAAERHHGA